MIASNNFYLQGGTGGTPPACTGLVSSTDPFGDGSLVAKYELDGDGVATVYNDLTVAGVTWGADGLFGECGTFTNDTAYTAFNGSSLTTTTMSLWFKMDGAMPSSNSMTFHVGNGTDNTYMLISSTYNNLAFGSASTVMYKASTVAPIADGNWHHIVFTRNAGVYVVYVDGLEIAIVSHGSGTFVTTNNLAIGCYANPTASGFIGFLDQVELYNRVLTADEVYTLYTQSAYCSDPVPDFIAHYPLTGTAEDVTGTYDGTESGNIYVDDLERGSVTRFDGVNDSITGVSNVTAKTISFWTTAKLEPSALRHALAGNATTSGLTASGNWTAGMTNETLFIWDEVNGNAGAYITDIINDFSWKHIVVMHISGGTHQFYVNAVSRTVYNSTIALSDNSVARWNKLGVVGNSGGAYYGQTTTDMSNVRFYDRVLTQQEITDIYEYEKSTHHIPVNDGLTHFYPLDNNSLDNYYNQADGADIGTVTYSGTSGNYASSYTNITSAMTTVPSLLSASIWVKHDTLSDFQCPLALMNGNYFRPIHYADGRILAYADSANLLTAPAGTLTVGAWYMVTLIRGATGSYLYVNGSLVASGGIGALTSVYAENNIGRYVDSATYYFDGLLSNARIYVGKELSSTEVKAIYDAELAEHTI